MADDRTGSVRDVCFKGVTPKRRPCRLQTVQTAQSMQTEYFFLTLDSLFSVLQLENNVKYVVMLIDSEGEIPFTDPKCTKIKHKVYS